MKEMIIRNDEAGQRLDKYLKKLLPAAGNGFLYKMEARYCHRGIMFGFFFLMILMRKCAGALMRS